MNNESSITYVITERHYKNEPPLNRSSLLNSVYFTVEATPEEENCASSVLLLAKALTKYPER